MIRGLILLVMVRLNEKGKGLARGDGRSAPDLRE
jgi:hypothetical protein